MAKRKDSSVSSGNPTKTTKRARKPSSAHSSRPSSSLVSRKRRQKRSWDDLPNEVRDNIIRHVFTGTQIVIGAEEQPLPDPTWSAYTIGLATEHFRREQNDKREKERRFSAHIQLTSLLRVSQAFVDSTETKKIMLNEAVVVLRSSATSARIQSALNATQRGMVHIVQPVAVRRGHRWSSTFAGTLHSADLQQLKIHFPNVQNLVVEIINATPQCYPIFLDNDSTLLSLAAHHRALDNPADSKAYDGGDEYDRRRLTKELRTEPLATTASSIAFDRFTGTYFSTSYGERRGQGVNILSHIYPLLKAARMQRISLTFQFEVTVVAGGWSECFTFVSLPRTGNTIELLTNVFRRHFSPSKTCVCGSHLQERTSSSLRICHQVSSSDQSW